MSEIKQPNYEKDERIIISEPRLTKLLYWVPGICSEQKDKKGNSELWSFYYLMKGRILVFQTVFFSCAAV